jgi:SAM-dependent methyltransferase
MAVHSHSGAPVGEIGPAGVDHDEALNMQPRTCQEEGPRTYWEGVATSRWGRYVSDAEEVAIRAAAAAIAGGPREALDVGCDGGRWTGLLADLGWVVSATDINAANLAICQDRLPHSRCVLVDAESETLPFETASMSLLICIEVHDVVHSTWFPREAARVLRPGGLIVVVTWNKCSLRGAAVRVMAKLRRRPDRFYRESYLTWKRRLAAAGFRFLGERGLCWFPFTRSSDSILVPIAVALERKIGLSSLPALSPWVLVTALRSD